MHPTRGGLLSLCLTLLSHARVRLSAFSRQFAPCVSLSRLFSSFAYVAYSTGLIVFGLSNRGLVLCRSKAIRRVIGSLPYTLPAALLIFSLASSAVFKTSFSLLTAACAPTPLPTAQAIQSGDWEDGSTWLGGEVPAPGVDILINSENVVTLNSSVSVGNVEISGGGEWRLDASVSEVKVTFCNNAVVTNDGVVEAIDDSQLITLETGLGNWFTFNGTGIEFGGQEIRFSKAHMNAPVTLDNAETCKLLDDCVFDVITMNTGSTIEHAADSDLTVESEPVSYTHLTLPTNREV